MLTILPNTPQTTIPGIPACFQGSATVSIEQTDFMYMDIPETGTNYTYNHSSLEWKRSGGTDGTPLIQTTTTFAYGKQPFYITGINYSYWFTPGDPDKRVTWFIGVTDDADNDYWIDVGVRFCPGGTGCDPSWYMRIFSTQQGLIYHKNVGFNQQFYVRSDGVNLYFERKVGYIVYTEASIPLPASANWRFTVGSYFDNWIGGLGVFKGSYQGTIPITWSAPDGGTLEVTGNTACLTLDDYSTYSVCGETEFDDPICIEVVSAPLTFEPVGLACDECVFTNSVVTFTSNVPNGVLTALDENDDPIGTVTGSLSWQAPGVPAVVTLTYTAGEETETCVINVVEKLAVINVEGYTIAGMVPGETFQILTNYDDIETFTTLAEYSASDETVIKVASATGISSGGQLLIDDERMLVTGVSGTNISVNRGYRGTLALDHANGAGVTIIQAPAVVWENVDCEAVVTPDGLVRIPLNIRNGCFGALDCYIKGRLTRIGTLQGPDGLLGCDNMTSGITQETITLRVITDPVFPTPELGGPKPVKWKPETPEYKVITNEFEGGCDETYLRNRVPIMRWSVRYSGLSYEDENPCSPVPCCDEEQGFVNGYDSSFQKAKYLDDFWNLVTGTAGYFTLIDLRTGITWKRVRFEGTMERDHINWYTTQSRDFTLVWHPCCATEPMGGVCAHNTIVTDFTPPTIPTGVTATVIDHKTVQVNWNKSTDNVGVKFYEVEIDDGDIVNTGIYLGYTNTDLAPGTIHQYRVRAVDYSYNRSGWSSLAFATLPDPDRQPPTTPTNLRYSVVYEESGYPAITIEWDTATDNVAVTGYKLLLNGVILDLGPSVAYVFVDTGRVNATAYIRAYDAEGNQSPWSSPIRIRA